MFSEKRKFGNKGEDLACRFLEMNKYKVIERNYLKKQGEIDIIAKKDNYLNFFEVKTVSYLEGDVLTRESDRFRPEENIHPQKLRRLSLAIQMYLLEKKLDDSDWKFSALVVSLDEKKKIARVKLIEDIVL